MSKYEAFSVVVQLHDQPPIDTPAYRPVIAREFLSGTTLNTVMAWADKNRNGIKVESVKISPINSNGDSCD